jgi:rhomboid protease GluP
MQRFPVTIALLFLILAGFAVQLAVPGATEVAAVDRQRMDDGELWRLVTPALVHANFLHLALNAWMLLQVGSVFELLFGSRRFAVLYGVSAVIASIASAIHLKEGLSVGASGAIFGAMGGLLVMMGSLPTHYRWADALRVQLLVWSAVSIGLGFFSEQIDNAAHVGGFIAGMAVALAIRAMPKRAPAVPAAPRARRAA